DQSHVVVTAGYGTYNANNLNLFNATYATTIWDGANYSITYTPVSTTLIVNLGVFSKPLTASWYDPTTGASSVISGSPFANSGAQNFTTPSAAHADGTHDWVLVLH
ncbi:MAG: putative collagen-binding domain-containing protein, partial [Candidatus Acidiferrum sp.]